MMMCWMKDQPPGTPYVATSLLHCPIHASSRLPCGALDYSFWIHCSRLESSHATSMGHLLSRWDWVRSWAVVVCGDCSTSCHTRHSAGHVGCHSKEALTDRGLSVNGPDLLVNGRGKWRGFLELLGGFVLHDSPVARYATPPVGGPGHALTVTKLRQ